MVKFKSGDYLLVTDELGDGFKNVSIGDIGICGSKKYSSGKFIEINWVYRSDKSKIMDGGYYIYRFKKISKEWVDLFMLGK